ncbi:MAG TPA: DUF4249 family protein [Saprospiraceae bacterium]|nr:DUF4249 family protein [Saprospiraceae bacterium]
MKIFGFISILFVSIVTITSCSNELELTAPWKDVPIVYGMLSLSDSAQYVRVERAFLDPKQNALHFTGNPDSIYYQNAQVSLVNLANGSVFPMKKVDGNLEGYVRDTGIWAQAPNYLYKIKSDEINLIQGDEYQIVIEKGDNQPTTKAQTQVIGIPEITFPQPTQKVSFSYGDFTLNWKSAVGAELYDVDVVFHYSESLESDPSQFVNKSAHWKALIGLPPRGGISTTEVNGFQGLEFYRWLQNTIPQKNVIRHIGTIDFIVTAGGKEIKKYFEVSKANFGITGSETLTDYTNIPGGYGIFSSLSKAYVNGLEFAPRTIDSLKNGSLTVGLNFQ